MLKIVNQDVDHKFMTLHTSNTASENLDLINFVTAMHKPLQIMKLAQHIKHRNSNDQQM